MSMEEWGWSSHFQNQYEQYKNQGLIPGRIIGESRHIYEVMSEAGKLTCRVSGHYMYTAVNRSEYPTVGDWVLLRQSNDSALIEKLLPRKSSLSRKRAGVETAEQVIAANADFIFLVFGLDGGRNFSRGALERFLTRAWDSGATPVIVLNKVDLCEDRENYLLEAESVSSGAAVQLTSALTGEGLDSLKEYLKPGKTVVFTGFSGVGKSALINSLAGEEIMRTGVQRESDLKGRHTTTSKSLIQLATGAILIDSPGIKELQLWGSEDSLDTAFADIANLAEKCRFSDCSHSGEPGCAVQDALLTGELDHSRFENYLDLQKELRFLERKQETRQAQEEKAKWKQISKFQKSIEKGKKHSF